LSREQKDIPDFAIAEYFLNLAYPNAAGRKTPVAKLVSFGKHKIYALFH